MDAQTLINFLLGFALSVVGWLARELWGAVQLLRADLHKIEVDLPKTYVVKEDLDKRMAHIEDMFQRIYNKLDEKANRTEIRRAD
jgi:hypothetical protein